MIYWRATGELWQEAGLGLFCLVIRWWICTAEGSCHGLARFESGESARMPWALNRCSSLVLMAGLHS